MLDIQERPYPFVCQGLAGWHVSSDLHSPSSRRIRIAYASALTADGIRLMLDPADWKRGAGVARILVADDNALSLEFFAESIGKFGHVADRAANGMEACQLATARRYELMILDSRMPLRSGTDALRAIRAGDGLSRETLAIATTADAGLDPGGLLEAGFAHVVVKPIGIDALHTLLDTLLAPTEMPAEVLDDELALARIGGDTGIMIALRTLLAGELDALPGEVLACVAGHDAQSLRERLHRLDASAGFCGAVRLARAAQELRRALDEETGWPDAAIDAFLARSAEVRRELA